MWRKGNEHRCKTHKLTCHMVLVYLPALTFFAFNNMFPFSDNSYMESVVFCWFMMGSVKMKRNPMIALKWLIVTLKLNQQIKDEISSWRILFKKVSLQNHENHKFASRNSWDHDNLEFLHHNLLTDILRVFWTSTQGGSQNISTCDRMMSWLDTSLMAKLVPWKTPPLTHRVVCCDSPSISKF